MKWLNAEAFMPANRIVILAGNHCSTTMIYNAVRRDFPIRRVIIEDAVPRRQFLLRRIKRLGALAVIGQVLFRLLIVPYLSLKSRPRIQQITQQFGLDQTEIDETIITRVDSANSEQTESVLRELEPDVVIVNGTRIVAERILNCIRAPFINMHAGITPRYRGVHGAYWALVEGNNDGCGVTIHVLDSGIDTGKVLKQAVITPTAADNFVTYSLLQVGVGIPILKSVLADGSERLSETKPKWPTQSKLWSHPTLFNYIYHRVAAGVK